MENYVALGLVIAILVFLSQMILIRSALVDFANGHIRAMESIDERLGEIARNLGDRNES